MEEAQAETQPEPQAAAEEAQPEPPVPEDFGLSMGPRDVGMFPEGLGVGSLEDREDALGPGKWLEQGRSAADITRDLPSTPIREIEIETGGYPWARFAVMGMVLAGGIAAYRVAQSPGEDPADQQRAATVADAATVQPLHTTHAAASDAPRVTITSNLEGARVTLDGHDHGRVPASVPVPMDQVLHEICVQKGTRIRCLNLAGEDLAARDPYRVEVEALSVHPSGMPSDPP